MDRNYGIQTLLMTDVVGSTKLWTNHPRIMPAAIECLEELAEASITAEGGEVVKKRGEGDSLFCVMPNPAAAARAATALVRSLRAQSFPEGVEIRIRSAIHCGPAHTRGADVLGPVPNRCARLREVGHGDQILLSGAARAQIASSDGVALRELGRHRLRDLDEPESVYQVLADDLPEDFPPLRSLTCLRNNLPTQYTSFIGRDELRRELSERLLHDRLTTLTGAGGSGKTRLSLQVGAESIDTFPDGVWFVELADLANETSIVRAIGDACGHRDLPDVDALGSLAQRLSGHGRALFLIDNAEHAILTIGRVVSALLAAVPDLRVLTTSREPLRLRGERVYRVPPLSVPPLDGVTADAVRASEAGTLFLDRARLRLPEFGIRDSNAKAIAEIVRRLDGIPLCLEMAASHVGYLGPDQIAARLHDRFALLDSDDPGAPPRHRTMRETIAWQYDTLREEEKLLLQRLAVFAGGFTLDAAEAVGGTRPLDPDSVLRHLRALVDKSLVVATLDGGEMRYRLLETIAQFAADNSGEVNLDVLPTLFEWASQTVATAHMGLYGPTHDQYVQRIDLLEKTIQKAIDWAIFVKDSRAVSVVLHMTRYWLYRGRLFDASNALERVHPFAQGKEQQASVDNAIGVFAYRLGDHERAERAYQMVLANDSTPIAARAKTLTNLAIVLNERGEEEASIRYYEEAVKLAQTCGELYTERLARYNLGLALMDLDRLDEAEAVIRETMALYLAVADSNRLALCRQTLASIAVLRGQVAEAARHLSAATEFAGNDMDAQFLSDSLLDAAWIASQLGERHTCGLLFYGHLSCQELMKAPSSRRSLRQEQCLRDYLSSLSENELSRFEAESLTIDRDELVRRLLHVSAAGMRAEVSSSGGASKTPTAI